MKKQLLKRFYIFIVTTMMFSVSAKAQIIYKDIMPDTTINTDGGVYSLDLNNDGINDFKISYDTTVVSGNCPQGTPKTGINISVRITPLGANEIGNDTIYPGALLLNSKIDSSSFKWKNNANQILTYKFWQCRLIRDIRFSRYLWSALYSGRWNGAVNKYIPLKLVKGSKIYYGWVRLDIPSGATSFIVKDYAYNTDAEQPILAGKTNVTGMSENLFSSSINLFPNPASHYFTIALGRSHKKVAVTISDISGKIIYTTIVSETQRLEVNMKDFAEGIYVVQIQADGFIATKKLVLEK
jgi:hypothetical protein